ncbi:putative Atrial natriuretic peptide receptor 1 [Hypsibius exemplaris]|uniref:guanylate cyclase n=1 Tax=Hypsibius exemplaris TaxID=2072580 RepID=A0A1W0WAD7_HYPEX|nr:putative Atrial natriuretic peptide receptor 1 [Hypsibius exemplaris]
MLFNNLTHIPLRYHRDGDYSALKDKPKFNSGRSPVAARPPRDCEAGNVADFFFKFYYDHQELFSGHLEQQFTIVTINDTKALLALSVPISDLSDIDRYPTVLNFFSMPDAYFVHTVALLVQRFRWSGINMLCNIEGGFEGKLCQHFDEFMQTSVARNMEIHKTLVALKYEDELHANFTAVYPHLTSQRVIMVLLGPSLLRTFMIGAHSRNMTNGDYEAFLAFRSLLIIADSEGDHNGPQEVNWKVHAELKRRYNISQKIEDEISRARHPFIAEFYGIHFNRTSSSLVFERPLKGPLHSVIRANEMIYDFDVRMQIMNAMILALHFIHTSDLSYHGAFSNEVCLINDRYVLRVTHAGFLRLLNLFRDEGSFRSCCRTSANKAAVIEQYRGDDIRNLGVVLADMFNIDPYVVKELRFESTNTIHRKIHEMVAHCLESESHARPTATDLKRWLITIGVPKKNFVELLLDRLEKHSATLEETVQSRTEALLDETKKVDDLLREILPSAIITKLRNHEPIIAEMFDSVTIMFSDIPAFGLIVAQSEPLGVIEFLNHLHTAFDRVVAQFDAYKVETINDSYVVASGLPVRNGNRHAEAICQLAQQLLRAGAAVHIPAWGFVTICPRIGINSGLGFILNLPTWLA